MVNRGHVTGVEKALRIEDPGFLLEIGPGDCWPTDLEPAEGLAVAGQVRIVIVRALHLDAERRVALFDLNVEPFLASQFCIFWLQGSKRAERAHLSHSPGMADLHAVDVLERLGHGARAS